MDVHRLDANTTLFYIKIQAFRNAQESWNRRYSLDLECSPEVYVLDLFPVWSYGEVVETSGDGQSSLTVGIL